MIDAVAGTVARAFSPGPLEGFGAIRNPLGIEGLGGILAPLTRVWEVLGLALVFVAAGSLFLRLRRAREEERQQVKWLVYAAAVLVLAGFLNLSIESIGTGWVGLVLIMVGFLAIPAAIGVAVLRYRLYDIDIVINRTLVYGSLTAALALVYFGGVAATQAIFRALTGLEEQRQLAIVVSTLVIAALFNPLRRRIQTFIDRRFYRRKYDARKTLEAFSSKLRDETDLEALNDDLVRVVQETMQPAHVSLWLHPDPPALKDEKLREAIRESGHDK